MRSTRLGGPKFGLEIVMEFALNKKIAYDDEKLSELIVYVADRLQSSSHAGVVKLNKILFYADFASFATTGAPITGVDYCKKPNGPVPRNMKHVTDRLEERKVIAMREDPVPGGWEQKRYLALRPARLEKFSAAEISLVDRVIERFRDRTGSDLSELSHEHAGWKLASADECIPYATVFLPNNPTSLTPSEMDWATSAAKKAIEARVSTTH